MPAHCPESAPHCPQCGYNLFGLKNLRCPECGHQIADSEDLSRARWLSDNNAANRATFRKDCIIAGLGVVLMITGDGLCLARLPWWDIQSFGYYARVRRLGLGIVLTAGYLCYRALIGGPVHRALLVLGLVWLGYGLWKFLA
jgi:hypothetical protein